mmetsp:Transcript_21434/g.50407  ORF Transcript_21434/g.50407 Transcript_21434/m.50407 type:complete len:234 (-) Transcript_21434:1426-2127(-)
MHPNEFRHLVHVFIRNVLPVPQVLSNRQGPKHDRVLGNNSNLLPEPRRVEGAHVCVVEQHQAVLGVVQPFRQSDHGAFAAPRWSHNGHGLTSLDTQVEVLKHRHVRARRIRKRHVSELDAALDGRQGQAPSDVDLWSAVEEIQHSLSRSNRLGKLAQDGRDHTESHHNLERNEDEGDEHAARELVMVHERAAVEHAENSTHLEDKLAEPLGRAVGYSHLLGHSVGFQDFLAIS